MFSNKKYAASMQFDDIKFALRFDHEIPSPNFYVIITDDKIEIINSYSKAKNKFGILTLVVTSETFTFTSNYGKFVFNIPGGAHVMENINPDYHTWIRYLDTRKSDAPLVYCPIMMLDALLYAERSWDKFGLGTNANDETRLSGVFGRFGKREEVLAAIATWNSKVSPDHNYSIFNFEEVEDFSDGYKAACIGIRAMSKYFLNFYRDSIPQ